MVTRLFNYDDISALDENIAFVVGDANSILKTTDGGTSWSEYQLDTRLTSFEGVDAIDENTIWVSGVGGRIKKSTDGGLNWVEQHYGEFTSLVDISAADKDTAWAGGYWMGDVQTIWYPVRMTSDGGTTWNKQGLGTKELFIIYGVDAVDSSCAWAVGGDANPMIIKSTDGETWFSQRLPEDIGFLFDVSATDENTAWAVGRDGTIIHTVDGGGALPKVSYYFAEGCTRDDFQTWLTLQNPGDQEIAVNTTYMLFEGTPVDKTYPVPAHARVSINVNSEVGPGQDVSVKLFGEYEFYAERPMYFNYKGGTPGYSWDGGHVSTGAITPAHDWYFAEGCTRDGFEEWLCIQNPGDNVAYAKVSYITAGAYVQQKEYAVGPNSRISVFVNGDAGPGQDVSIHVESNRPIVAECPMYFNYQGKWEGGHVVMGTDSPKNVWYFAERTTRGNFDMWLAVQNANNQDAQLTVRFLKGDGAEQVENYAVGANSRWTLNASVPLGVGVDSAVVIESSLPVVAERPMYFTYGPGNWKGGHAVIGASNPSAIWFFPEGCTRDNFDEYICVANPGGEQAHVVFTFMLETGETVTHEADIAPSQRLTVSVPLITEATTFQRR